MTKRRKRLPEPASLLLLGAISVPAFTGCGVVPTTDFPNTLRDDQGRIILLDNVEAIVHDADLSDDEKRDRLRDLGLEDEKLIDSLLML